MNGRQSGQRLNRRLFFKLLAVGTMLASFGKTVRADSAIGVVSDLLGLAFAESANQRVALRLGSGIDLGDEVVTDKDSRLEITFGDKTSLRLGSETRIIVDHYLIDSGGVLNLRSGALLLHAPNGVFPDGMKIAGPFALIAVRGTTFFAGDTGTDFSIFVENGTVDVTAAGATVKLRSGEGTSIASPGAAPDSARSWGPEKIAMVMQLVR